MEAGVDTGRATGTPSASRGRRFALAVALLLAAGVVVAAIVLGTHSGSPRTTDNPASAGGAAIVRRRDLVETDTESGTLAYASPQTVYNRLSGTITWLPAVGQLIRPGQTLYTVNGRPVVLFDGALPAYRALTAKDSPGQDILQLNSDLVQMGFADGQITIDDAWQTGTTDAVERWQATLGREADRRDRARPDRVPPRRPAGHTAGDDVRVDGRWVRWAARAAALARPTVVASQRRA